MENQLNKADKSYVIIVQNVVVELLHLPYIVTYKAIVKPYPLKTESLISYTQK